MNDSMPPLLVCDTADLLAPYTQALSEAFDPLQPVERDGLIEHLRDGETTLLLLGVEQLDTHMLSGLLVVLEQAPETQMVVLSRSEQLRTTEALASGIDTILPARLTSPELLVHLLRQAAARCDYRSLIYQHVERYRRAVEDLKRLINNSPVPHLVLNARDEIRYCNAAAAACFRLSKVAMIGQPFGFAHTHNQIAEIELPSADASARYVSMRSQPIRWENADATLVILDEVTGQRQTEAAHHLLAAAIEQCQETIIITDPNGCIQYANPAFTTVSGYAVEEAIGASPSLLKSGAHSDTFYQEMWATIQRGEVWRGRIINRRKDGNCYEEEASISPIVNEQGEITHYVGVKRDVTKMVDLEEQLHQAQKMEAVGRLAGGVAHDFNNLLTVIGGHCQLLRLKYPEQEEMIGKVRQIQDASDKASALTRRLLSFSRKSLHEAEIFDFNQLLTDFEKMLVRLIGEDIELSVELTEKSCFVDGDPGQIEQVIMNLAVNARDAMPDGGRLTIATRLVSRHPDIAPLPPGQYVQLMVTDCGCGMDRETVDLIFEPFFTTKEVGKGTGLGLAMTYAIVKQCNGHIKVHSELGVGTTFSIYLPLAEALSDDEQPKEEREELSQTLGDEIILIVEDEEGVRQMARDMLQVQGYNVLLAQDAEEALRIVSEQGNDVDLMLTDVVMPGMSGIDLANHIHEQLPELPVLFMSGYSDRFEEQLQNASLTNRFLQKPFSPQELGRKVKALLTPRKGS